MKILSIASANLRRMLRERSNIFFVFIFPIALILLIGIQFGGGVAAVVGIHQEGEGTLSDAVIAELTEEGSVDVRELTTRDELISAVERGSVNAGVFLPAGMEETVAGGGAVEVGFVARPDGFGNELRSIVGSAVADALKPAGAARYAAAVSDATFDQALGVAREASGQIDGVAVDVSYLGESLFPADMGRFDLGAPQQLVLFTFITVLAGSAALILSRKLGISRRMLATPTPLRTVLLGESMGRFTVGMFQGLYIMLVSLAVFSVDWGNPVAAVLLLAAFTAVGAGAAMLMGAVFSNEQQAGGVAVVVALGMAALGGSMVPLELFPPAMQRVAMVTPHAWALSGFSDLVRHDGGLVDILPEVGVLIAYAAVLFAIATWRLRRALTSG